MKKWCDLAPSDLQPRFSPHARKRIGSRRLPLSAVNAVMAYGSYHHVRGADIFVMSRRDIERAARKGLDMSGCAGIHVVCSNDGVVLTAYRNHNLKGLRPRGRSRWVPPQ